MRFLLVLYCFAVYFNFISTTSSDGIYKIIQRIINQCNKNDDVIKCFKIQGIKMVDNAARAKQLGVIQIVQEINSGIQLTAIEEYNTENDILNGVSIIKNNATRGRSLSFLPQDFQVLQKLKASTINTIFWTKINEFFKNHALQFKIPYLTEESRRKKGRKYIWPLAIALAVKTIFMAMSYQGVAVMSGAALILGKIALLLSAILGLKKLVASAHDKSTTLEIIKHPQHSHSHTYSNSYEDDYYHRAFDAENELDPQRRIHMAYFNDTHR